MENYLLWKDLMRDAATADLVEWWQEIYVYFYQAFIEGNRWVQYFKGVGTTLMATALALMIGVILGVIVAMIRTAHDQQRPGKRNLILGMFNAISKVYVTVIRGTPMMVQAMVIYYGCAQALHINMPQMAAALCIVSINTGAYLSEIVRGGIQSVDPGQREAAAPAGL